MLAQMTAIYVGAHQPEGREAPSLEKFLIYRRAWEEAGLRGVGEDDYSETDLSVMRALR